ncbi:MAG: alpha/beta fold hydrolase [Cyanobacteria bacterium]|nr:alpha/beta fold hydrolase [Cyanobacteriota bacterium]
MKTRIRVLLLTCAVTFAAQVPLTTGMAEAAPRDRDKTREETSDSRRNMAPCQSWINPIGKPQACLLCIHGLGLHSGSYEFFAKEASQHGVAVFAIDVRGFGSWMKAQGREQVNFQSCIEDIKNALESIHSAYPGLPVFILGESMGGAIALRAAAEHPDLVDGLVSSVPAAERFKQGRTSMKVAGHMLAGPNKKFDIGSDIIDQATKNEELKREWKDDPLARMELSPKELIQFQEFMNDNHDYAKKIVDMPVLFVQGTADKLVKPEGTWELFNDVATTDKVFLAVPSEHLIFEEAQTQDPNQRLQNMRMVSSWLVSKLGLRTRRRLGRGLPPLGPGGNVGPGAGGPPPGPSADLLRQAVGLIDSGKGEEARKILETLSASSPQDTAVRLQLGRAYSKSGDMGRARREFLRTMKVGGADSLQANQILLSLSNQNSASGTTQARTAQESQGRSDGTSAQAQSNQVARGPGAPPWVRPGGRNLRRRNGGAQRGRWAQTNDTTSGAVGSVNQTTAPDTRGGRPTVYAFYANWCDQCSGLDSTLDKLSKMFGPGVAIEKVDITQDASDALVDRFNVGPIPTAVFVRGDGTVSSTLVGESRFANYAKAVGQMIGFPSLPLQ